MYLRLYSLAVLLCILLIGILTFKRVKIADLLAYGGLVFVIGLLGSRVLSILESTPASELSWDKIFNNRSGLTFYGGYIPLVILSIFFIQKFARDQREYLRIAALFEIIFHLGYSIGRLGCHLSADGCYGRVTFSGLGIRYTWGYKQTLFPVFPTPVYEMTLNLFLCIVYLFAFRNGKYREIVLSSLFLFPLSRFLIEFIRTNRMLYWGLTLNQFISLGLVMLMPAIFLISLKTIKNETGQINNNFSMPTGLR
ncbi:prolipoprotein diacylglyceryl transferase family protein [Rurimicrobium arvi]|uniref:prolipoprotein diacylglyceryl transferase family protein n=1 Tax=Rurimicrobium arvi TaxID=2049916 RepID=UPI0031DBE5C4